MVLLGVESEAFLLGESLVVLRDILVRVGFVDGLAILEHEFFEESFGVDLPGFVKFGLLLGKTDIQQVLLEVPGELEVILALVPVEIQEYNFRTVERILILHHRNRIDFDLTPILFTLLMVLLLKVSSDSDKHRVNQQC